MTREEAKKRLEVRMICANCTDDKMCYDSHLHSICKYTDYCDEVPIEEAVKVAIKALEQKPSKSEWEHDHEILKAYSDGANAVLDMIRAEIEERKLNSGGEPNRELAFNVCLQIIDGYMTKHDLQHIRKGV